MLPFAALAYTCALTVHRGSLAPINIKQAPGSILTVAMYGDSTMLGLTKESGVYAVATHNAPTQLAMLLKANGYHAVVTTTASNGSMLMDLQNGTHGFRRPWKEEMAVSQANIVVINSGLNDCSLIHAGYDDIDKTKTLLIHLITIAQRQGKTVFIESPNPRYDTIPDQCSAELTQMERALTKKISNLGFIDEHTMIESKVPNWRAHLPDALHPDSWLYNYKACVELNVIAPAIPRQ